MNILFAIGSRANLGSSRSVIERLRQEHNVSAIAYGTAVLPRYGDVATELEAICETERVYCHVEGETRDSTSLTASLVQSQVGAALARRKPDLVFCIGDRYEVVPVAYAAHLLGIPIGHVMGGEISGTIDDANRDAITRLATWHFVATEKAAGRVRDVLGVPGRVFVTGCPRIDVAAQVSGVSRPSSVGQSPRPVREVAGSSPAGGHCPGGYVVVSFHPDVHQADQAGDQMRAVLDGVMQAWDGDIHVFWPNADPGAADVVRVVRERMGGRIKTHRNMRDEDYYSLLAGARCCVGNSSSFIREGSYLGVPVVLVGDRQKGREMSERVLRHEWEPGRDHRLNAADMAAWVKMALLMERPEPSTLYGDGHAAERIAEVLRAT